MTMMNDRRAGIVQRLQDAVLRGPGSLTPAQRQRAAAGLADGEGALAALIGKVRDHAYRVTDEDIADLHRAGYTDDQIFEAIVSVAVGQGLRRRERALAAILGAK